MQFDFNIPFSSLNIFKACIRKMQSDTAVFPVHGDNLSHDQFICPGTARGAVQQHKKQKYYFCASGHYVFSRRRSGLPVTGTGSCQPDLKANIIPLRAHGITILPPDVCRFSGYQARQPPAPAVQAGI
jgi:hypothetical protein